MQSTIVTALIGAVIAFLFGLLNSKLNKMIKENEDHHSEHKRISVAERECLLAIADTSILTARKVNDRNSVNGELEASVRELQKTKKKVQDLTREIAFERLED